MSFQFPSHMKEPCYRRRTKWSSCDYQHHGIILLEIHKPRRNFAVASWTFQTQPIAFKYSFTGMILRSIRRTKDSMGHVRQQIRVHILHIKASRVLLRFVMVSRKSIFVSRCRGPSSPNGIVVTSGFLGNSVTFASLWDSKMHSLY